MELRRRTAQEHLATEESFAVFDLSQARHYSLFLQAHAMAHRAIEPNFGGRGFTGWSSRTDLIAADLTALHAPRSAAAVEPLAFGNDAEVWGAQYVIEGSRLGGVVLDRQVPADLPRAYLSSQGEAAREWRRFCDALTAEAADQSADFVEHALVGARKSFAAFRATAELMTPRIP